MLVRLYHKLRRTIPCYVDILELGTMVWYDSEWWFIKNHVEW